MKNIRLKGYDYSRHGAYFITICVKGKHKLLGEIPVGAGSARPRTAVTPFIHPLVVEAAESTRPSVALSSYGKIVAKHLNNLPLKYPHISISKYVIMPNHIHCIILVSASGGGRADPAPTLGQIIAYFKFQTTKEIDISGFWQRSYHDHIIRTEDEYRRIINYIETNPTKWSEDRYHIHP